MADADHDAPESKMTGTMSGGGSGPSLTALVLRAQGSAGRDADAALDALVERLYPICERFVARRLNRFRDAADVAADAAQETMVRVAAAINHCHATTDREIVAWVLVTARRTLIDMYRSPATGLAARSLAVELQDDADTADTLAEDFDERASARGTLLTLALQAYDALKSETAKLLWWRLVRGAEWAEVAENLATTPAGAKRRFQRAQSALRRSVGELVARLPAGQRAAVEALVANYRSTKKRDRDSKGGAGPDEDAA